MSPSFKNPREIHLQTDNYCTKVNIKKLARGNERFICYESLAERRIFCLYEQIIQFCIVLLALTLGNLQT